MSTTIKDFINEAKFDDAGGGYIWGVQKDGTLQMIAEVRGWGAICNLFPKPRDAEKFQDSVGQFIVDAINEKLSNDAAKSKYSESEN